MFGIIHVLTKNRKLTKRFEKRPSIATSLQLDKIGLVVLDELITGPSNFSNVSHYYYSFR